MKVKCKKCKIENDSLTVRCLNCGTMLSMQYPYVIYSKISLIFGCISLGFFWWIAGLLSDIWWIGAAGGLILTSIFCIIILIGIILGIISLEKGRKLFSILGILLSLVPLILCFIAIYRIISVI